MADDFTAKQFRWLNQIAADPTVTAAGFVLAYRIAKHINRGTGEAWPSQPLLATEARLSVRSIRDLSDQLKAAGHLTIIESRGRGHSLRYRWILHAEPEPQSEPEAEAVTASPAPESQEGELFPDTADTPPKSAPRVKEDWTADFDSFWTQFPRRVSKAAARLAYDKARKGGATAVELEVAAMRYGAVRTGEDPKYTKHAATWLNGKCWLDEPEPTRGANFGDRPQSSSQRQAPLSHVEIALAGLNRDD
jgi:hypothetical protein